MKLKPFKHQTTTTEFILNNTKCLITSDPGTGKTRSVLDAFDQLSTKGSLLVLAPLSILQASWGDDIQKFTPNLSYSVAYARNRTAAFSENSNIVITNHDAVKWLAKNPDVLDQFTMLCIDEFTAFKNANSQRSKAALAISHRFDRVVAMSGTPNSNSITDIWHPAMLVDGGERLGRRFYTFRQQVCTPIHNGFGIEWRDKEDAEETVAVAIGDISIRFELEQCIDMPEQSTHRMYTTLPKPYSINTTSLLKILFCIQANAQSMQFMQVLVLKNYCSYAQALSTISKVNLLVFMMNATTWLLILLRIVNIALWHSTGNTNARR